MLKWLRIGRIVKCWAGAALIAVLTFQGVMVPRYTRNTIAWAGYAVGSRVDPAIKELGDRLDRKDKQIDALITQWGDLAEGSKLNAARIQSSLKSTAEILHYVRWQILPEVKDTMTAADAIAHSMQSDIPKVMGGFDAVLKTANADAGKIGAFLDELTKEVKAIEKLTVELDVEIQAGSKLVGDTAGKLDKALDDFDKLLGGDDLKGILKNSNAGTKSLAESLESINQVLMPLRKKVTLLKMLLSKAVGVLKIDPTKW